MMRVLMLLSAAMIAGCSGQGTSPPVDANSAKARPPGPDPFGWPILDGGNKQVGIVTTRHQKAGVAITLDTLGLPAGLHGVHIHETPKCEPPAFESAGPHWNWTHKQHGHKNPQGYHAGDLGNLSVAADGRGKQTFVVPAKDWDPKAAGGWSIVIHAQADDEKTDPSGNSGARIACGVFFLRQD